MEPDGVRVQLWAMGKRRCWVAYCYSPTSLLTGFSDQCMQGLLYPRPPGGGSKLCSEGGYPGQTRQGFKTLWLAGSCECVCFCLCARQRRKTHR